MYIILMILCVHFSKFNISYLSNTDKLLMLIMYIDSRCLYGLYKNIIWRHCFMLIFLFFEKERQHLRCKQCWLTQRVIFWCSNLVRCFLKLVYDKYEIFLKCTQSIYITFFKLKQCWLTQIVFCFGAEDACR